MKDIMSALKIALLKSEYEHNLRKNIADAKMTCVICKYCNTKLSSHEDVILHINSQVHETNIKINIESKEYKLYLELKDKYELASKSI
jgi:hypothetical protein